MTRRIKFMFLHSYFSKDLFWIRINKWYGIYGKTRNNLSFSERNGKAKLIIKWYKYNIYLLEPWKEKDYLYISR